MKHGPTCRKQLADIMPNYGSDCTCGLDYMLEYVTEKWDEGPEAVAEYLNEVISWVAKVEGREVGYV